MILIRDIFQLKFGKAKDALALTKQADAMMKKFFPGSANRYLTDLTGPFYTLVWESTHENLSAYETSMKSTMGAKEFGKWYKKFILLVESGRREIFTIVG